MKAHEAPTPPPPALPPTATTTTATAVPDSVLRAVHASDQAMYPVALPYARLRAWVDACPDLSVCFSAGVDGGGGAAGAVAGEGCPVTEGAVVGVVVVLPLRKRCWEDLLRGRLKEPDIDPGSAFPGTGLGGCDDGEEEVGLHVYHVERFDAGGGRAEKRFCEFALGEVMRRAQVRRGWKVVGISGAFDVAGEMVKSY